MLPSWCTQTIKRIRPCMIESRGSFVPDWSDTEELMIRGCSVQPTTTGLSQDGRVLGISEGLTIYCPPGSDIMAGDRIEYGGNVYTINGEPKPWIGVTGLLSHVQINVERWRG